MELCSQLNYVRSLSPGKAYFYYLDIDGQMSPLRIDRTHVITPKSGYAEAYTGQEFKQKNVAPQDLAFPNPQFIEECYVPPGVDEIYCAFSLRIQANSLAPDVCSDVSVRMTLTELAEAYRHLDGYRELARRYAKNILIGSWVWRNRACRQLSVHIQSENQQWSIDDVRELDWFGRREGRASTELEGLTNYLTQALSDPKRYGYLDIKAKLKVGWGDEVFPSQEFLDRKQEGSPTRQFATVLIEGEGESAAFHAQKIGAAIQLIDDWWSEDADKVLRVNEYGADKKFVIARRHPTYANDFYTLIRKAEEYTEDMNRTNSIPDEVHFVMAILVKGGLFNHSSSKNNKKG